MTTMGWRTVRIVGLVAVGLTLACENGGTMSTRCDADEDCPTGNYCDPGGACTRDCGADRACSAGATCDVRGRCVGGGTDGGTRDAGCTSDEQCDDGVFCNGAEVCGSSGTCASAPTPRCMPTQTCDEPGDRCVSVCDTARDADGDGDPAIDCGGHDCDDSNPRRSSLRAEECDELNVDEDCDPCTIGSPPASGTTGGDADLDEDGYWNRFCCNRIEPGTTSEACPTRIDRLDFRENLVCGTDCSDRESGRYPTAPEACDGLDNDCDSEVDEVGRTNWWPDFDGDGRGNNEAAPMFTCQTPMRFVTNDFDCDDSNPLAYGPTPEAPGAPEICNNYDEDCDSTIDEDDPGGGMSCNPPGRIGAACQGVLHCVEGALSCVQNDSSYPRAETCNNVDDDCDGNVDNFTEPCTDVCGAGTRTCSAGVWGACSSPRARSCSRICGSATSTGTQTCTPSSGWGTCSIAAVATVPCSSCAGATTGAQQCLSTASTAQSAAGTLGACSASTSAERPCPHPCNDTGTTYAAGRQVCTAGTWSMTCTASEVSRRCTGWQCGSGTQTCTTGHWNTCQLDSIPGGHPCPGGVCGNGWSANRDCTAAGSYGVCYARADVITVNGSDARFGHSVGYASGTSWYIPAGSSAGTAMQFSGTYPAGTYRVIINGRVNNTGWGHDGVWVDFPGYDNYRLPPTSWSIETTTVVSAACGSIAPGVWYRGSYGPVNMWIDSVTIRRM